jgi:hypothetical protein
MAYALTDRAKQSLDRTQIEPNIVLTIKGYPYYFGADNVFVEAFIGQEGLEIGNFDIGGTFISEFSKDYISLTGSTNSVSHQLEPDKGGATSTQSMKIKITDFNQEVTKLISPGFEIEDILYRDANVYLGFKGGAFPEDYIDLFSGKVQAIKSQGSAIELTIAHPEDLKRSEIFPKIDTVLTQDLDYFSVTIQDLRYTQRGDFSGTAQVRYLSNPFSGDTAIVSVGGNLITVQIDTAATKASTIKRELEASSAAMQLVSVKIVGNGANVQAAQAITTLTSDNEVFVESVTGFLSPVTPLFRTYLKIDDEILEYTGIDTIANKFTGVTRADLDSFGDYHDTDAQVSSFYKLGDNTEDSNAIDLTLKLLMSGGDEFYADTVSANDFVTVGLDTYTNGILFRSQNLIRTLNIRVGDYITTEGATNGANNVTEELIEDIFQHELGTVILVSGQTFVYETESSCVAKFKSQYATLPDGVGMVHNQVDIDRFEEIKAKYGSSLMPYEFYLKDTVTVKEFINESIYLPSTLYAVPRKGRVSVGITAPPLYENESKILDPTTIKKPSDISVDRSVNKNFYNAIVYKYNEDSVTDKFKNGRVILSNESTNRINAATKPYTIQANGLRPGAFTNQNIERNARRYLERYKFAAEMIPVEPDFKTGFEIEVGDTAIFGGNDLKLSDSKKGSRDFSPRIFEVVNKEFNWVKGSIKLSLVDTNYSTGVRYGVWSPSSKIISGSTTSVINIQDSYGISTKERDKWNKYIGKKIRVHSPDYSYDELTVLQGFSAVDDYKMLVSPALPSAPLSGYVVDVPNYDDIPEKINDLYKAINVFVTPTLYVTSGTSGLVFDVSVSDAAKLFVNSYVRVHDETYDIRDSGVAGIQVESIVGTTVTLKKTLGFTPIAGDLINLVGFVSDEGNAYVWA